MLAKKYRSKVVAIENPIDGIYSVEFISLGRQYKYTPGQFIHIAIDQDYDGVGQWPDSRCFSIQSGSNSKHLKITFSIKGDFTTQMAADLQPGKEVWLKLPYGELFAQSHNKDATVFISGGTGITPFLSLFTDESFEQYQNPKIYLGFRSQKFNIYADELRKINNDSHSIKYFIQDENGVIDIHTIFKENGTDKDYFISGPPEMIKNFKNTLIDLGVHQNRILTDDWE